jgi:hypothetical protein
MSKMFGMALAGALAVSALAVPSAEAGGRHKHRFIFAPYHFHTYKPICGRWFWSYRRDRYVCAWWY